MDFGKTTSSKGNSFGVDSDQREEKDKMLNAFCRGGKYIY